MTIRDAVPTSTMLALAALFACVAGCEGIPRLNPDNELSPAAQRCVQAQRDERQWCTNTAAHGLQSTQFRCLEARRRVAQRCAPG